MKNQPNWRLFGNSGEAAPLLATGEHFLAEEFFDRYEKTAEDVRAQLINGIVYMSPFNYVRHGSAHANLLGICGLYTFKTPIVKGGGPITIVLDEKNVVEPDGFVWLPASHGGTMRPYRKNYLQGGPELVFEIANSRRGFELREKLEAYSRAGTGEYVVWSLEDPEGIEVFFRHSGKLRKAGPDTDGIFRSEKFPGLWINLIALLSDDLRLAAEAVEEGTRTKEHAKFVKKLREGAK